MSKKPSWESEFRKTIKKTFGKGWGVRGIAVGNIQKVQITRRDEDGDRSSALIDLEWRSDNQLRILNAIEGFKARMKGERVSLKKAVKQLTNPRAIKGNGSSIKGWENRIKDFLKSREDRRPTTLRDLQGRMDRVLQVLSSNPRPRDGQTLCERYAEMYFKNIPSGGVGRRRNLNDVSAFLRFCVSRCGENSKWLPPDKEFLAELVGTRKTDMESTLTTAIKPEDLSLLLESLERDGKAELYLATALIALYGLRPAELGALEVKREKLYIHNIKRNAQTLNAPQKLPRRGMPLNLKDRPNEGERVALLYQAGLTGKGVKLPLAVLNAIKRSKDKSHPQYGSYKAVGDSYRQLIERFWCWQQLVKRDPNISPYSLRHGFALRAHRYYHTPISVKTAADLMGHSPATHNRNYSKYIDEDSLEREVERAVGQKVEV